MGRKATGSKSISSSCKDAKSNAPTAQASSAATVSPTVQTATAGFQVRQVAAAVATLAQPAAASAALPPAWGEVGEEPPQRHARRKSRKQQQQEAATKRKARQALATAASSSCSGGNSASQSCSSSSTVIQCICGSELHPGTSGHDEIAARVLQRQQHLLKQQQELQQTKQHVCSDELMDEIRALDVLYPPLLLLQRGLLSETFIAEVEHTRAAAAAAFATLQAGSHKVNPWDAGRLFSTACATFLVLSPLNCFHCRYDASSAASAPSFSNKRTTRGANSSRADTGLSDDGSSSSSRSRSRCSSTNKERSSSLDSCNLAALTPQQQLKVAFRCRCECCGSRLGSDGRGLSSSSGNTNESIRIAFHISTFRTEEHIAVIDALLPPTYPTSRPTVCIGLSCNPSKERLGLLLQQLSTSYFKEPREVLLHALALHLETFLVELPSQPNLWEEMQQRVQQQQQQQQHLEQLQLQLIRDRARQGTLHKTKSAAAAAAAAEAAAARDGDAATTQQQAAEFHMAVAARLRGDGEQTTGPLSLTPICSIPRCPRRLVCHSSASQAPVPDFQSCLYGGTILASYCNSLKHLKTSPSQRSLKLPTATAAGGWFTPGSSRSSMPLTSRTAAAELTGLQAAAATIAVGAAATIPSYAAADVSVVADPAALRPHETDGSRNVISNNAGFNPEEHQQNIFSFLQHIVNQQPRHRRDFLLVEVLSSQAHKRSCLVRHMIDSRLYVIKEFFFCIPQSLLQRASQGVDELQQQLQQRDPSLQLQQQEQQPQHEKQQQLQQRPKKKKGKKKHKMQYTRVYDDAPQQQPLQQEQRQQQQVLQKQQQLMYQQDKKQQEEQQQQEHQEWRMTGLNIVADAERVLHEVAMLCTLEHPFLMRYHQCWSQLVQKTSRLTTSQSSPAPSQGFPHHTVAASPAGRAASYAAPTAVAAASAEDKPASDKLATTAAGQTSFRRSSSVVERATEGIPRGEGAAAAVALPSEEQAQLSVFVQMEYFELTLQRFIREGRTLRISDVWRLFMQLLEAMVCVHRAGACHRALHPSNVFLVDGPEGLILKVGDFGLRELLLPTGDNPFLAFVAPEVRRGETFSDKADMYSIGMLFLELWLLCPVMARLSNREAIRTNFNGCMPPRAVTIANLLLQEEPNKRPSSLQLLQSGTLPPAVDAGLFEAFLLRVGGCSTAEDEDAAAASAATTTAASSTLAATSSGSAPLPTGQQQQQQNTHQGRAHPTAPADCLAAVGAAGGTAAGTASAAPAFSARVLQQHREQRQSSSSTMNARVQLTREVLNVLFARPLDPRSRRAFVDALQQEELAQNDGNDGLRGLLCSAALQHFGAHGAAHQSLPLFCPAVDLTAATTGVVALTASNLLLSPTVHLSSAFAALDAAAASVFPPCCSSLQLQQPPAAAAAVAAAAAATRALPGTAEWHQFVMSAAIAATANAAAASVQPQQRMLLDGEVFKRFCVGPAYAVEQQQGESARGPFGQVLPQLACCFQILYPLKQQQQQQQQQKHVLQHLLLPATCQTGCYMSTSGSRSPSTSFTGDNMQQDQQRGMSQQVLQQILNVLSYEDQQLVVAEGELLLVAVTSLHNLLATAGIPPSCGTLEFALPQLVRPLLQLFFRIPRSDVEEAVVELLQLCQKDPQRHVTQRPQQACVSLSDCSKVLYQFSNLEVEELDVAAEQLQQLLEFSGDAFELLLLLQNIRNRLTAANTQVQQQQQGELQECRPLVCETEPQVAAVAEAERELSHAVHLSLLLQAAVDTAAFRCVFMRFLLPPESPNYDVGRLVFGVFLNASFLRASSPAVGTLNPDECPSPSQTHQHQVVQTKMLSPLQFVRVGGGGYIKLFPQINQDPAVAAANCSTAAAVCGSGAADPSDGFTAVSTTCVAAPAKSTTAKEPVRGTILRNCEPHENFLTLSFDLDLETVISLVANADAAAVAAAAVAALQQEQGQTDTASISGYLTRSVTSVGDATHVDDETIEQAGSELGCVASLQQQPAQQSMQHSPMRHIRYSRQPWVILTTASSRLIPLGVAMANRLIRRGVVAVMRIQPVIEVSRFQEALRRHPSVKYHVVIQQQQKTGGGRKYQQLLRQQLLLEQAHHQQHELLQQSWQSTEDNPFWHSLNSSQYIPLAACSSERSSCGASLLDTAVAAASMAPVIFSLTHLQKSPTVSTGDSSSSRRKAKPVRHLTAHTLISVLVNTAPRR